MMRGWAALLGVLALLVAPVRAQDHQHMQEHEPMQGQESMPDHGHMHEPSPAGSDLSGLMLQQQMRHAKLWFAGSSSNWPLAEYELNELQEGFDRVKAAHAMHEGIALAELVERVMAQPLTELGAAIAVKDSKRFAEKYDRLTASCNACHTAARHPFIVIQRPTAPPFTNQVYTPPKH